MDPAITLLFPNKIRLWSGLEVYQLELANYWIDFIPNGPELVITFENVASGGGGYSLRDCWGLSYLKKRDCSVLGVKWKKQDWYRGKDLHRFFRAEAFHRFAKQFTKHTFMGSSMGGYAAVAFAEVLPGALVLAHHPQSTLDSPVVPWETRYTAGREQDWSGDFGDAARCAPASRLIYLTYDPFHKDDRRHADRISGPNVVHLKMPFLGHRIPEWLLQMNILTEVTDLALSEQLTTENFARLLRARRTIPQYYLSLYNQTRRRKFKDIVLARGLQLASDANFLLVAVKDYFAQGKYALCIALCQSRSAGLPDDIQGELRAFAAMAMHRTGQNPEQVDAIVEAINWSSRNASELIASAGLLNEVERYAAAERVSRAAITIAPRWLGGYRNLVVSQRGLGQPHAALASAKAAEVACGFIDRPFRQLMEQIEAEALRQDA